MTADDEYDEAYARHMAAMQEAREERQEQDWEINEDEESDEEVASQLARAEIIDKREGDLRAALRVTLPAEVATEVSRIAQERGMTYGQTVAHLIDGYRATAEGER